MFAAEHFIRRVQPWTCAAAPIHDPRTGRVLGAVDITGGDQLANPQSLAFVQAPPRRGRRVRSCAAGPTAAGTTAQPRGDRARPGRGAAAVRRRDGSGSAVGTARCWCCCPAPGGADGRSARPRLYGDDGAPGDAAGRTVPAAPGARPGAAGLAAVPAARAASEADFLDVVERGWTRARSRRARCDAYAGPLLPGSDAPGVARLRRLVDGLRAALLRRRRPGRCSAAWTRHRLGADDLEVWRALAAALPAGVAAPARSRPARRQSAQLGRGNDHPQRNVIATSPYLASPSGCPNGSERRRCKQHDPLRGARHRGDDGLPGPLRPLHRRRVRAAGARPVLREPDAGDGQTFMRGRPRHRGGRGARPWTRRTAPPPAWGRTSVAERAVHPQPDRRPDARRTWSSSRSPRAGRTASRSARPWPPTSRWPSTTSATSPGAIRAQEGSPRRDRRRHRGVPLPRAARRGRRRSSRGTSRS